MLKISFDFDSTLGETIIQKVAAIMMTQPNQCEVYIVTARNRNIDMPLHNRDLYNVAKRLNIADERIFFTEDAWKWMTIKKLGIDIHLDDVPEECELIAQHTTCLPLLLWDIYCKGCVKVDSFGTGKY